MFSPHFMFTFIFHVSCYKFRVSCLMFYVHYYRSTHILCSLLHILSNLFHVYCSMFHVIIFQIPQNFSFLPPFHVYVQILYCKFRVTCFYGKQISFYSRIISCKSSEANVSNNDGHGSSNLARLSEQFSFNTSKT